MVNELSKEIKARLYDRISDPLLISFIISYAVKNWRIFMHLFGSQESTSEKIKAIESIVANGENAILPAILALFYTFVYPWFKYFISWYSEWVTIKIKNRKTKTQAGELLSIGEGLKVKAEYDKYIEEFSEDFKTTKQDFGQLLDSVAILCSKEIENEAIKYQVAKYKENDILFKWVKILNNTATPAIAPNDSCSGIVIKLLSNGFCVVQIEGFFSLDPDIEATGIKSREVKKYYLSETKAGTVVSDSQALTSRIVHKIGRTQPTSDNRTVFYIEQQRPARKEL